MAEQTHRFRIVIFKRGEWWIAQCLERLIAAQAKTYDDVVYEIQRMIVGFIVVGDELGRPPFDHLPPAAPRYHRMFEEGAPTKVEMLFEVGEGLPSIPIPQLDVHHAVNDLAAAHA